MKKMQVVKSLPGSAVRHPLSVDFGPNCSPETMLNWFHQEKALWILLQDESAETLRFVYPW